MKYMIMMFGSSEAMLGNADPAWVKIPGGPPAAWLY